MVPHLHWHVIARFDWDSHFPRARVGAAQRPSPAAQEALCATGCQRWRLICAPICRRHWSLAECATHSRNRAVVLNFEQVNAGQV